MSEPGVGAASLLVLVEIAQRLAASVDLHETGSGNTFQQFATLHRGRTCGNVGRPMQMDFGS